MILSWTYWRHHKKRAFAIMISVTLSMAALVCTAFLARSASTTTYELFYMDAGNYDILIPKITEATAQDMLEDDVFSQAGILYRGGTCRTADSDSFMYGALANESSQELYHNTPMEGRYPQASGEIAAQKNVIAALGVYPEIGARLTFDMVDFKGNYQKTEAFTVVGILDDAKERDISGDIGYAEMTRGIRIGEYAFPSVFLFGDDLPEKEASVLGVFSTDADAAAYNQALTQNSIAYVDGPRIGMMAAFTLVDTSGSMYNTSINLSNANKDFNAKVLIPVFTILVLIVTFLSTYDVMTTSMSERSRQFGLMRCLGMTRRAVFTRMVCEAVILVTASLAIGFAVGAFIYWLIVTVQINVLGMKTYYAFSVNEAVAAVSLNPYVYPAVVAFVCASAAVLLCAVKHIFRSPLEIFAGQWDQESMKARKKFRSAMSLLSNRLHSGISQNITTAAIVAVVMCAGFFGYLYFSAQTHFSTSGYQQQLNNAHLNGLEYLSERDFNAASCGIAQLNRHNEGVTPKSLEKLKEGGRQIRYTIEAKSTKVVYTNNDESADIVKALAGCDITLGVPNFLYDLNEKSLKQQGYKQDEMLFNIPTVGIDETELEELSQYLAEGDIDMDALMSGDEILILETDNGTPSPYHTGDILPLTDIVIDDESLENFDFSSGLIPEGYEPHFYYHFTNPDGTPEVGDDGTVMQWPGYGFGRRQDFTVRVGGKLVVTDEALANFYFSAPLAGDCGFNLVCLQSAFECWGLPDRNYTKVGAVPGSDKDIKAFDKLWFEVMGNSAGMKSISTADIRDKMRDITATTMSTFFAMVMVLVALGLFGIVNTVNLRVRKQSQTFAMLRAMGMGNTDLKKLIVRQNLRYPLIGALFCWIPVAVFEIVRQHIIVSLESGLYSGMVASANGKLVLPWYFDFPYYLDLLAEPVSLAFIITVLGMAIVMILASIMPMRWLGRQNIAETIRRDDF